jgi:IclR family KDG regulon transcriptional repressor
MQNKNGKSRKVIASVQRALDIINLFEGAKSEIGNAEIAQMLDLDPGTVSGLIHTLKLNNYLEQNPANRKYRLGLKLAERAAVLLDQLDIRKISEPYLENLRKWSGESTNLAIRDHQEVVYIERLFGSNPLGIRSEIGKRAPIHSTALGKAIVAYMNPQDIQVLLADYKFFPVTPKTITNEKQFLEELGHIREKGFAIDEQENELGGRCLAAPIFDHDGIAVAALSISVPIQRLPEEKIPVYGTKVKEIALEISHNLGYFPK